MEKKPLSGTRDPGKPPQTHSLLFPAVLDQHDEGLWEERLSTFINSSVFISSVVLRASCVIVRSNVSSLLSSVTLTNTNAGLFVLNECGLHVKTGHINNTQMMERCLLNTLV